jgi:hypothetical protein
MSVLKSLGRSMSLTDLAGIRVLDHLEFYGKVRAQGFIHEYGSFVNIKGDLIGKLVLRSEKLCNYPAVRIFRNSLRQVLLEEASSQGIDIRYDMRAVKVQTKQKIQLLLCFKMGHP